MKNIGSLLSSVSQYQEHRAWRGHEFSMCLLNFPSHVDYPWSDKIREVSAFCLGLWDEVSLGQRMYVGTKAQHGVSEGRS